jgi:7-cyano-7-deazaguanine synthase in queuosine biosynthesis
MKSADTLLFLSGGLDSTAALVRLLRETGDAVHVHYIYYMNRENRFEAEQAAVGKIIPYCRQRFRDFESTRSVQDYHEVGLPADVHVVRFTAAQICLKNQVKHVATGRCKDDESPGYLIRLKDANAIFNACTLRMKERPTWSYPVADMSKAEEVAYLEQHAPETLGMIHYCRRPVKLDGRWINCHACKTCAQMARIRP